MPAFGPLAESLVKKAALRAEARVIDLGTGIGAAAFPAGRVARRVVGLDYAPAMLPIAQQIGRQQQAQNVIFHQGDMHRLPYRSDTFSVALASFGFNGVDPRQVFHEVRRILQPGGRLVLQEWGQVDEASRIVKETVKAHQVEQANGFLADLRLLGQTPRAWDELNDEEDIARLLRRIGFRQVDTFLEHEALPLEPLAFYRYKTAWAPYQAELAAMSPQERTAVEGQVIDHLNAWTGPDGRFIWKPELIRIIAEK
jgi:ubiquinone/menaquinone biosynthesis C-methylase UbiE